MVYVVDEGGYFKASLDKLWRYNAAEKDHYHPSMKNIQASMEGQSMILTFDSETPDKKTVKRKVKLTNLPPVGFYVEELEGQFAGSKYINYYVPKGEKTEVKVVGEWTSPTIPADKLKKAVSDYLDMVFKEDSGNLAKFK
ncbi:MAG: hypothetical protein HYU39_01255 [Thaumarchaeota archaeon]|nr:hypothetical protein [Nitrososphaerota archaeon]